MDVLMISPGYPAEMPIFTEALAAEGANVIGVGDQPVSSLARRSTPRPQPLRADLVVRRRGAGR